MGGDVRQRLHTALLELGFNFTADAVEHSDISEVNGELRFVTPREFKLAMTETDVKKAAEQAFGRPMRIAINIGSPAVTPAGTAPVRQNEDEVTQRALAHPDVQRFREVFPEAEVRQVRNLKE
jgi:hypothetical protein